MWKVLTLSAYVKHKVEEKDWEKLRTDYQEYIYGNAILQGEKKGKVRLMTVL